MTNEDQTAGRTTMMSARCGTSMSNCNHQPAPSLQHSLKHKTINNQDIYRMNAAISEFQDSLTETIKVYQAGDKTSFIDALKVRQGSLFYVKEQKEQNPEFDKIFDGSNDPKEVSQQLWYFLEQYKKNQRLNEDWDTHREIQKALIDSKYAMPYKQKLKLELLRRFNEQQQKYQQKVEEHKELLARLATSDKSKNKSKAKPDLKPLPSAPKFNLNELLTNMLTSNISKSVSRKNTDITDVLSTSTPKERRKTEQAQSMKKPIISRLDQILKNKPPKVMFDKSEEDEIRETIALNVKKPYFKNDKKLKDKIHIGENVFQREYRQEVLREGYTKLLKKIKQTDLARKEITNGQTLFDKDLMNLNYNNPYLKNQEMRNGLIQYIEATKPLIGGNHNLSDFIDRAKPIEVSMELGTKDWAKEGQRKISIEPRKPSQSDTTPLKPAKTFKNQSGKPSNQKLKVSSSRATSRSKSNSKISATNSNERQNVLILPQPQSPTYSINLLSPTSNNEDSQSRQSAGPRFIDDFTMTHVPIRLEKVQHPFGLTKHESGQDQADKVQFPANPSFVNNYVNYKAPKVPKLVDVLEKKNIPTGFEEQTFYKIKQARQRFKQYAYTLNTCYETGRPSDMEIRIAQLDGTSRLPAHVIGKNGVDKQFYIPMVADPQTVAKLKIALKQGGKGLGDVPSSFYEDKRNKADAKHQQSIETNKDKSKIDFPQGSVINQLVGIRPYAKVDRNTIKEVYRTAERNKRSIINEYEKRIQAPIIVDQEPIPSLTHKQDLPPPKKRAKRLNDPLRRIFRVNNEAFQFSKAMNKKLIKILERQELDKPIMMQDKLDMIWDKPEGKEPQSLIPQYATAAQFSRTITNRVYRSDRLSCSDISQEEEIVNKPQNLDQRVVRRNLKTRKLERQQINEEQVKVYQKLIEWVTQQRTKNLYYNDKQDPSYALPEETVKEFLDAYRIIIQSGYYIDQKDFMELLDILKVQERAQTKQQRLKIYKFFMYAAAQLRFDTAAVDAALTETWLNEGNKKIVTVESETGGVHQISFAQMTQFSNNPLNITQSRLVPESPTSISLRK